MGFVLKQLFYPLKGGDPAAPSGTAALLRLHPPCQTHLQYHFSGKPVGQAFSSASNSGGVTGGVYKG